MSKDKSYAKEVAAFLEEQGASPLDGMVSLIELISAMIMASAITNDTKPELVAAKVFQSIGIALDAMLKNKETHQ